MGFELSSVFAGQQIVTSYQGGAVVFRDLATLHVIRKIESGGDVVQLSYDPVAHRIFAVGTSQPQKILRFDVGRSESFEELEDQFLSGVKKLSLDEKKRVLYATPENIHERRYLAVDLPSYVALRLLLESAPRTKVTGIVDGLINQVTIRKSPRIMDLKRFKNKDGDQFRYRKYSIPSPSSALADCYAIAVLQHAGVLLRRDYVFSYRPPGNDEYTRSFEYFSSGYKERNTAVEIALSQGDSVAIIADLRNFYPSVDANAAADRLLQMLMVSKKTSKRDAAVVFASARRCFSAPDQDGHIGLRVGPEMSHVLADLSLESLDNDLKNKFPGRYFRYVDDIVIVVEKRSVAEASRSLYEAIDRSGFSRSEEKDAEVGREEWVGHNSVAIGDGSTNDYMAHLKFRIKMFLAKNPDQLKSLRVSFADAGIFLP
ncbi:MAG: RNA-directed DNA polymerase, partial [Proteobacteria bacterium]